MKGRMFSVGIALILLTGTALAGSPGDGNSRATVTVTAYVLPKSVCTINRPTAGGTDPKAVRCETQASPLNPAVRVERVEPRVSEAPKVVLTVLP